MTSRDELCQLNGNLMNSTSMHKSIGIGIVLLVCLPLSTGCTSERSVHDAQAELAAIRRDLAAARIATSKQEGEAAELRRNITVQETDRTKIKKSWSRLWLQL